MKVTDEMVHRFLAWELPKDFGPDGGVAFTREVQTVDGKRDRADLGPGWWPVGTNLLTAEQARAMLTHVLATTPVKGAEPVGCADDGVREGWNRTTSGVIGQP